MSRTIEIRPGDLDADRDAAVALLSRHMNPAYDRRRFDWVYRENPAGPGRIWLALDGGTGEAIGTAGALPRRMYVNGAYAMGWALTDFCISDTHRSLGPALRLQRTCLEGLAADGVVFWYDFPGPGMEAVYRRLGISPRVHVTRFARPLKTYAKLRQRLGSPMLARAASLAADLAVAWATRLPRDEGPLAVGLHAAPCGEEFTALAERVSPRHAVCVWRSAQYLNWRYCDNPIQPHEFVTARLESRLVAYAVVTRDTDTPTLVDLFGEAEAVRPLIRSTVAHLRKRGAVGVSAWLADSHPWAALLRDVGFRPRETAPVMVGASPDSPWARVINDTSWFLVYGDRDT